MRKGRVVKGELKRKRKESKGVLRNDKERDKLN